jgi:hypothetical protein
MRMRTVIICAAAVLAFGVIAVESLDLISTHVVREHQKDKSACPHDKEFKTYEEWTKSVTFPYVAPDERLQRVRENYSRVGVGSSKDAIVEAFGPPDYEREMIPMEPWRPCIGYEFYYSFSMLEAGNDNEIQDKRIEIFLNVGGKAEWIAGNVGLPEKGGPAHHP